MGLLRRAGARASAQAMQQYEADRELAEHYAELLSGAELAERELRDAEAGSRPLAEIYKRNEALDHALGAALKAALAGERAAGGPKAYDDRIARRRASVRDEVRRWTGQVSRLRTAREVGRLKALSRTGTLVPSNVTIGAHAMSSSRIPGAAQPGQADDALEDLDQPRVGVNLDETVGERRAHI